MKQSRTERVQYLSLTSDEVRKLKLLLDHFLFWLSVDVDQIEKEDSGHQYQSNNAETQRTCVAKKVLLADVESLVSRLEVLESDSNTDAQTIDVEVRNEQAS